MIRRCVLLLLSFAVSCAGAGQAPSHPSSSNDTAAQYTPNAASSGPDVTRVNGRLPPPVIQGIVRQNYGKFRACYEDGLRRDPKLQGRVAIRFVIGRDGAVSNVIDGGSDMPDALVIQCVVQAYHGLSFPQPEGGIVTVVYPVMFSPGD